LGVLSAGWLANSLISVRLTVAVCIDDGDNRVRFTEPVTIDSMELSPYLEADSHSTVPTLLLYNPKVRYHTYKTSPLDNILR
jgi:hypothetical protein